VCCATTSASISVSGQRCSRPGGYGFGPTTAAALEALDFDIDVSVNPRYDYTGEGGPSFGAFDTKPFFFGRNRRLLEIPLSTDYTGVAAGTVAPSLHRALSATALQPFRAIGVAARLGIVNRIMLSPRATRWRRCRR
jgi:hypothetical protein